MEQCYNLCYHLRAVVYFQGEIRCKSQDQLLLKLKDLLSLGTDYIQVMPKLSQTLSSVIHILNS